MKPQVPLTGSGAKAPAKRGARASRAPAPAERRRRRGRLPTKAERETFLAALSEAWSVKKAAEQAGVAFQRFYELRKVDAQFADEWASAFESGTQRLEDEAVRRGLEGYDEETRGADGEILRSVRRFDSALLQQQLKARRPEVYRENTGIELKTPAVFVLDSAFGRGREVIEGEAVEITPALPPGEDDEGDA